MLIENHELTMSHVGLGNLNEYALLLLFGNAHSHHLTDGTGFRPDQMADHQGLILYPAYFMTHLKVPSDKPLDQYRLWDEVSVGVDISRFGETILESDYLFGPKGAVSSDKSEWDHGRFPSMKANSLIVVDVTQTEGSTRKVSAPKAECIAELSKLAKPPYALMRSKKVRTDAFGMKPGNLKTADPVSYRVPVDQDAAPGHAMVFAKFSKIMDAAEFEWMTRRSKPGFPVSIARHLFLLERETYYYGNCFADEELDIYMTGHIEECDPDFHGESLGMISVAKISYQIEVYMKRNHTLLAISKVDKLLAVPTSSQDHIPDYKRVIRSL
ncbi:LnmK family bifunctional acyltransferase/decarboxylase [Bacillus velezensis]|uniref:LnmK family bifunctional acyltransferase/decarboxylase n=1 Tax=Bacillus velezensis TaxID=492670 RepID=UPI0012EB0088|nr:LnmK family bifunctional acyltransferase/decarboxylase [Bacillus velezensis]